MSPNYPAELPVIPSLKPVSATVTVPGSKSITNRALILAAMQAWTAPCELRGVLRSEDTEVMVDSLRKLGFFIETQWNAGSIVVSAPEQTGSEYPPFPADLFVANSGTSMRFLAAFVSFGKGRFRIDGVPRMRERPIQDLLDALNQVGVIARSEAGTGCPPVVLDCNRFWRGNRLKVRGDTSSQFLTALLMVAPLAVPDTGSFQIEVDGPLVSQPYIDMTLRMMETWGLKVQRNGNVFETCHAAAHGTYRTVSHYEIESDASAASYFWAAAAITGGRVTVTGLTRKSLQGDVRFVDVLEQIGCRVEECEEGITVHGKPLHGIDVDMNDISDTVMTLAAVACFAEGPTTIRNVGHIRHKETDRIAAVATELRKLGAEVEVRPDGLTITPRPLTGCAVDTYNDHRMAMSLSLIGLKVPGVVIRNPGCVAKTYPGFWQDFAALR
jgi:3-phosphoshikimate 1-carboxyvinyltransferase